MPSQLQTIQVSGAGVDMSPRFSANNTVVASPATAGETVVATVGPIASAIVAASGVYISAQIAYTVGTSGTAARYRIRQGTTTAGTVIFDTGPTTAGVTAAALVIDNIFGFDASPTFPGQAYCLTLLVAAASATSTVSAAVMAAQVI